MRRSKVRILYKSGNSIELRVDDFKVTRYSSGQLEVTWDNPQPKPLLIGVDEIEAVYEL